MNSINASDYTVIESKTLFQLGTSEIRQDLLEYQGQRRPYFYLVSSIEAVATLGQLADGQLLLTHQYRHPVQAVIYDLPAGSLKPDEMPLDGARREFEEETGYYPEDIRALGYYNQFPGTIRAGTHLFFARSLRPTHQNLDDGEVLEIVSMSVSAVLTLITSGQAIDGSLQMGVLLALQKGWLMT